MTIAENERDQYHSEGYVILEHFFSPEEVDVLRRACETEIREMDRRIDAGDTTVAPINHKGKRYFIPHVAQKHRDMSALVFGEKMAAIARMALGDEAYLFLDQYVVKAADHGMKFSWHQDAGYIKHTRVQPYLTCWIALDDMTEENGTVYILPFSRAGSRDLVDHEEDEELRDQVGYRGDDPGIPAVVPAGTLVAFTSHTFHRSSSNRSSMMRRAYLVQYSREVIRKPDGSVAINDVPFLKDGKIVDAHIGAYNSL